MVGDSGCGPVAAAAQQKKRYKESCCGTLQRAEMYV